MAKLNLAVLKAHRLNDTSTFGKQNIFLKLTAGSVVKTSETHQDAGTDCALGEIFSVELPPGIPTIQIDVIAKHSLTGDESLGTASLACDLIRDSDGEVLRVPVMSKKGSMNGELECTGSISETGPSAPQLPPAVPKQPTDSQQQQQQYAYPYPQQPQQQPGPYPAPYAQQQQQQPYVSSTAAAYQQAPGMPYPTYPSQQQQQQQQQHWSAGPIPPYPQALPPYPPPAAAAAVTPYPPPAGYPTPQQVAATAPMQQQQQQQQQQQFGSGAGRGGGLMGTALAAGAGALGGAVVGGAISNALFSHHGGGWGHGGGWNAGPGYYDGGDTVIVNNYNIDNNSYGGVTDNQVTEYQVDDTYVADDSGWVDMGDGGGMDSGGGDW